MYVNFTLVNLFQECWLEILCANVNFELLQPCNLSWFLFIVSLRLCMLFYCHFKWAFRKKQRKMCMINLPWLIKSSKLVFQISKVSLDYSISGGILNVLTTCTQTTNLIVVITSQYISISNHYVLHFKITHCCCQ